MNEIAQKDIDFTTLYNKVYRLAAAVFTVASLIDQDEDFKTKIKKLSLEFVSLSINLKDISMLEARKSIRDIEKNSLELISLLDIAAIAGLISKMNGSVLKEEFQSFITELKKFTERFEDHKNVSVKNIFANEVDLGFSGSIDSGLKKLTNNQSFKSDNASSVEIKNGNGSKRKDLRKVAILDFIKGHNNASIKDIVPNIVGCSEKTVQRELLALINEGKIVKIGERRWSRYSAKQV